MQVVRTGSQYRRSHGCRNRHSVAWNAGLENGADGDECSLRRVVRVFRHPASALPG